MNLSIIKSAITHGIATSHLLADSVRDSLVYGFEQLNSEPQPHYDAKFHDIEDIASSNGPGWTVNGQLFLRSVEATNRNYLVIGNTGSKKSVTIACQLLNAHGQSFIVTDPSGSLANISARYLRRRGYKVFILDFNDPLHSCGLNLLDLVANSTDAGKLASHLVRNTLGDHAPDKFWEVACIGLLRICIVIVSKMERKVRHIKNVQLLLLAFAANREAMNPYAVKHLSDTEFAEFRAIINGNEKTIASVIATCQASLEIFNSDNVSTLCSYSSFTFEEFQTTPCVLFIKNNTWDNAFFRPILSTMIESAFKVFMSKLPQAGNRQVQFILDECSSIRLSPENFETVLANCRKHALSICCMYQHTGQILAHLGVNGGQALMSNCFSKLILSSDLEMSNQLEQLIGKRTVKNEKGIERIEPLMPAQSIRNLEKGEALFFYGSVPYKLKVYPFFEQPYLRLRASNEEYKAEPNNISKPALISLK